MTLQAVDRSLERLLLEKVPLSPTSHAVAFDPPTRQWTEGLSRDTVNLYLYDVRENHELRSTEWGEEPLPDGSLVRRRPAARIDLCYLVTAWSGATVRDVVEEHRLLGAVLRTLLRFPTLPPEVLLDELAGQRPPPPMLVAQPNGISEPAEVWSALDNLLQPFLQLLVTISVEPSAYPEVPERLIPVAAKVVGAGPGVGPTRRIGLRPPLREAHAAGAPVRRAEVGADVLARLAAPVFASASSVTVAEGRDIRANTWLLVEDSDDGDLLLAERAPGSGPATIPARPPLRFPHPKDAEVRVVTVAPAPRALLLQEAATGATSLRFAGTDLADGARLLIRDGARTEPVRVGAPGGADPLSRPIRRPLRFPHEAGAGLHDLTVATSPVTTLRDPANQPASTLTLDGRAALDSGELAAGTVVHLDAGPAVELARLGPDPAPPGVTVPVAPALQGTHPVGAALRRVTDRADAGVLHLAATAGEAEVVVSGEQANRLHPGDVVGLGPPGGTAYHQVTANSPVPGGVVRSAETLVQIGGLITDRDRPPNPVAGASVLLVELRLAATTGADGRFVFTNLSPSPDPLTLRVTAAGYTQGEKKVRVPSQGRDEYHLRLSAT